MKFAKLYIILILLTVTIPLTAQIDSVEVRRRKTIDSTELSLKTPETDKFIENIKSHSKRGFARFLTKWLIRKDKKNIVEDSTKTSTTNQISPFEQYNGKVVRNIEIISLKPYEKSRFNDEVRTRKHNNWFTRTADNLHVRTNNRILRQNLMFKQNERVQAQILDENIAYIRNLSNIYDAQFIINEVAADSVDITVISRDVFSIDFDIKRLTETKGEFQLLNNNIFGTGTQLGATLFYSINHTPHIGYGFRYKMNNFLGSFINADVDIRESYNRKIRIVSVERELVPHINYIGGLSYNYIGYPRYLYTSDTTRDIDIETYKAWGGKAFYLNKNNMTRFVAQLMTSRQRLVTRDLPNIDSPIYYPYEHSDLILAQFSVYRQRFHTNRFIYSYGANESTPVGYNVSAQFGYENHIYFNRFYASASFAYGKQLKNGYHYHTMQFGSFIRSGKMEQGVFRITGNYFSNLFQSGKARMRQFINVEYTAGINRLQGESDYLFYTEKTTIDLYHQHRGYEGRHRLSFSTESTIFTNARILGSRLVCFAFLNGGTIGNKINVFKNNFFYGFGCGIRLANEFWAIRTLEIRFGWYPKIYQGGISQYVDFDRIERFAAEDFRPKPPAVIEFK